MSVQAGRSQLATLTKALLASWHQTREHWRDAKSQEFEQKFMNELQASVNAAVANTEELAKIMAKIRGECE